MYREQILFRLTIIMSFLIGVLLLIPASGHAQEPNGDLYLPLVVRGGPAGSAATPTVQPSPTDTPTSTPTSTPTQPSPTVQPSSTPTPDGNCSPAKLSEVVTPATSNSSWVSVDCNLNLEKNHRVTKRLILEGADASNVTIDCHGATIDGGEGTVNEGKDMIEIRSHKFIDRGGNPQWERPENITVRNCNVTGSIRVWGMAKTGEGTDLRDSSRQPGHVERTRNNAPRRIVFDNMTITGTGRNPLYFAPGVSHSSLLNSEIKGRSNAVNLYLDAESYSNVIRGNYLHATTADGKSTPVMAIDGSSNNVVINNRFSALNHGGIYLYRNCGEGGTIRHMPPRNNTIINNVFYYNVYTGGNPAVYLGSRNGNRDYCDDDSGYPYGSSVSDRDYAQYNVVMQNQIYKRSVSDMIKTGSSSTDSPNYIAYNETVTDAVDRPAGCYVGNGYETNFILHGQRIDLFKNSRGEPVCTDYTYSCNDGVLVRESGSSCRVSTVPFSCQISDSNAGCQARAACVRPQRIIGAKAACNLEFGTVSDQELADTSVNTLRVVRASDTVSDGQCFIGDSKRSSGEGSISGVIGYGGVPFGCSEKDKNGGDCHVRGVLYCQ
jgi:hypothetical protein